MLRLTRGCLIILPPLVSLFLSTVDQYYLRIIDDNTLTTGIVDKIASCDSFSLSISSKYNGAHMSRS